MTEDIQKSNPFHMYSDLFKLFNNHYKRIKTYTLILSQIAKKLVARNCFLLKFFSNILKIKFVTSVWTVTCVMGQIEVEKTRADVVYPSFTLSNAIQRKIKSITKLTPNTFCFLAL